MNTGKLCPVCEQHRYRYEDFFEVCPVCGWEDDGIQRKYPDFWGGANEMSLNQARKAFAEGKEVY